MKFKIKFGKMKTETIVKGIMFCIAVLIIYRQIPWFSFFFPAGTEITPSISILMSIQLNLAMIGTLIIELILLRLFCEVIYNIVAAAKCIIKEDKEKHDQNLQG